MQSHRWSKSEIERKLKEVFPDAKYISVLDSTVSGDNQTDTWKLPLPRYKGIVTEQNQPNPGFIFYFYNTSLADTATFTHLFRATMIHDIVAGMGTKKVEYVLGMPQFDNSGNRLVVYAVSLSLPESYNIAARENAIRKVFALQETKLKDVRLSEPK